MGLEIHSAFASVNYHVEPMAVNHVYGATFILMLAAGGRAGETPKLTPAWR